LAASHVARVVREREQALVGETKDVQDEANIAKAARLEDERVDPGDPPAMFHAAPFYRLADPILISTPDGIVRYANDPAARLCKVNDASEVIGLPLDSYVAPDTDPEMVRQRMEMVYERREPTPVTEYEVVTETGDRRTVWVQSVPVEFDGKLAAETTIRDVTGRRDLETRLKETEERIQRLIKNARPIVFMTDERGVVLVFEGRDLTATSYRKEDLVGSSIYEAMPPTEPLRDAIATALDGNEVDDVMTIGGGAFDVWIAPVHGARTTVSGCIGMAVDVSDRIRAEKSLREERDLLARIFETSPVAITVLDVEGNITRANDRAEEVLGLRPNDIHARSYDDPIWHHTTVDGKPLPDESQPFVIVMSTGKPVYDVRHAIEWPDGRRRILSINGAPLRDSGDEITGAMFVVEDVTAEYLRRQIASERQQKVRALYEAMSRLMTLETPGAVARRMLQLVHVTMGYNISAVRLRRGDKLVPACVTRDAQDYTHSSRPDYDVEGPSVVARAYRSGKTLELEDIREANDGYDRGEVRSVAYIPFGSYGIITIGTTTPGGLNPFDVQVIEILARNAETVLSRLENEQELRRARDMAEEVSRLKSAMLANMSHEVRTPLTSIVGFAEVITEETTEPGTKTFANRIRASSLRLRDTLDSVLHLSRLEADAVTPEMQPVNLVNEARGIADELDPVADLAGVDLRIDMPNRDIVCSTDPFAVQRILRNLIGNAVKFTPDGGSVTVSVEQGTTTAMIEVADTGIGMTKEFQERMYDAFTQESEGMRRKHEGSGLGLAIVHKLVTLIGASMEVESTRGYGTRFAVFIPNESSELPVSPNSA
jgi:PAS domain S-box-containing protein